MYRSNFLLRILAMSVIAVVSLPIVTNFYIYPLFSNFITQNIEDEAVRVGSHLSASLLPLEGTLDYDSIPPQFSEEVDEVLSTMEVERLKVFSPSGEIIYSTEKRDIGKFNRESYFHEIVESGNTYTQLIKKDTATLEGRLATVDVIETYVPILRNGSFAGAFEIYYDITARKESLDKILSKVNYVVLIVAIGLFVLVAISAIRANRTIVERNRMADELRYHRDRLEKEVKERTESLERAKSQLEYDIEVQKRAEEALKLSEEKFRNLFEFATDAIFILDFNGNFIDVNKTAYIRLGYTKEEMMAMNIAQLDPPEFAVRVPERFTMIKERGFAVFETAHKRKDGTVMPVEVNSRVLDYEGIKVYFSVIRDITKRKQAEEQIKRSLKEKEVLIQEIHHRVKNNMQVISSMLKLQARYTEDPLAERILQESRNRVRTMALINEKLYQSADLSEIDFGDYVRSLINELLKFVGEKRTKIDISVEIPDIYLSADTAIPCGLIINELFANSINHAFPEKGGRVKISLSREEDDRYHLVYSDNGVGLPSDIDYRHPKSLGLELIILLAEHQLKGSVELDRSEGTRFDIRFKELKYKKRI